MPPKSSKKEDIKLGWHDCDKCGFKITTNQLKSKELCTGFGINKGTLIFKEITNSLPADFDKHDVPVGYFERFIFIPESISQFCNFTMNCNVLIELDSQKYVKSSFTVKNDKFIDRIYSMSKGKFVLILA